MLLKAVLMANILAIVISLRPLGMQGDTSIVENSKQLVEQYREIITQFIDN